MTGAYVPGRLAAKEVWLVDLEGSGIRLEGSGIRRRSGLAATDLKWSSDGWQLAIGHGAISLLSVATDDLANLDDGSPWLPFQA